MSRIARPDAVSFARNGEEARPGGNRPRLGDTDPSRLWFSRGQQHMLDRLRAMCSPGVLAGVPDRRRRHWEDVPRESPGPRLARTRHATDGRTTRRL
jgi:hypothetical protein